MTASIGNSFRTLRDRLGRRTHYKPAPAVTQPGVQSLEARWLLSVSAVDLAGPQTVGTQRTYLTTETGVPDETTVKTVIGAATDNGHSATETDEISTTSEFGITETQTVKNYQVLTADGFVGYGADETEASSVFTTSLTYTYDPFDLEIPASLSAGVTVPSSNTETTVASGMTSTETSQLTATLESETPTMVTVPAGTFSAYAIDNTLTQPESGGGTQTIVSTDYYAVGVGMIKEVVGSGSTAVTTVLTNFNGTVPPGGTADHLLIAQQPTTATAAGTISPPVTVQVVDASGNIASGDASQVTIRLGNGTGTGNLSGTTTVTAQNGLATFSDLAISAPGTYSFVVSDGALTGGVSNSFTVNSSSTPPTGGTLLTTTTLADTAPTIMIGGSEVFTSKVAPVTAGGPVPTGSVTFFSYNGTYPTQIETVQGDGTAAMPLQGTIPGYMAFIAFYSGDANYAASNSALYFRRSIARR